MLQTFSCPICSEESGSTPFLSDKFADANSQGSLEVGLGHWKIRALSILKVGAEELRSMMLKVFNSLCPFSEQQACVSCLI